MQRDFYGRDNRGTDVFSLPFEMTLFLRSQLDGPYENPRLQSGARLKAGGAVTGPLCDGSNRTRFVLLVEDDAAVRRSLMTALVDHGFDLLQASSGDEGLSVVRNCGEAIDVAVVDMAMPMMWGDEFAERLALVSPNTKVIFISGHSEEFLRMGGSLKGNEIFFPKPFSPKLLLEKIRELMGIGTPAVPTGIGKSPAVESPQAQPPHFAEYLDLHIETDQRVD